FPQGHSESDFAGRRSLRRSSWGEVRRSFLLPGRRSSRRRFRRRILVEFLRLLVARRPALPLALEVDVMGGDRSHLVWRGWRDRPMPLVGKTRRIGGRRPPLRGARRKVVLPAFGR